MNNELYSLKEHLDDSWFIKWYLEWCDFQNPFREKWAKNHLDSTRIPGQVTKILTAMEEDTVDWEQENLDRVWQEIQNRMDLRMETETSNLRRVSTAFPAKDPLK
ncbi:hypothetical protein QWY93_08405 [Echinicola jeungdonensis]|uniref:Uncharacterized protein n=1 Tax=Echinicola jeungdonensis TaxID=709343 RepID=A0ABV5J3U2_9BACT|nr:hypothetical protein [Echinicola jeungdonensis]MDN3669348.1 hypothetical protein [Echinicola jeungdonensis]